MLAGAREAKAKALPRDWKRARSQRNLPRARQCVVCGKIFYTTTGTKTCSPEHHQENLRRVRNAAVRRYQQSVKGKETRRLYGQSAEQKEYHRQYYQSDRYREIRRRYEQSEKGQATRRRRVKPPGS